MDFILHSSETVRSHFQMIYPTIPAEKHRLVGLASDPDAMSSLRSNALQPQYHASEQSASPLSIAWIGNVSLLKGAELLLQALPLIVDLNVNITFYGRVDETYEAKFKKVAADKLSFHGPYLLDELPGLIKRADLALHISIWPETYCLGLDESRAAGLVPIVTRMGALAERVTHGIDGFVIGSEAPEDLVRLLSSIVAGVYDLKAMQKASLDSLHTATKHFTTLNNLYGFLVKQRPVFHERERASLEFRRAFYSDVGRRRNSAFWSSDLIELDEAVPGLVQRGMTERAGGVLRPAKMGRLLASLAERGDTFASKAPGEPLVASLDMIGDKDIANAWRQAPENDEFGKVELRGWAATCESTYVPLNNAQFAILDIKSSVVISSLRDDSVARPDVAKYLGSVKGSHDFGIVSEFAPGDLTLGAKSLIRN